MDRAEKESVVEELGHIFAQSGSVVVAQYAGLTVAQLEDLRNRLRVVGGTFRVAKNRLAKLALKETNEGVGQDMFTFPTGIAFANDPIAAPKVVMEYIKAHDKLVVIGGLIGKSVVDAKGIEQLSKMPSIQELRVKLLGVLNAPGNKLVRTLNEPAGQFVRQLSVPSRNLLGVLQAYKASQETS
ncbi:MAG: 50S ribosomal protein L10 [Hyphomicrobiaceae bacterium hypho_1]